MLTLINYLRVTPSVSLTDEIRATELIPPGDGRKLSANIIWILANEEYLPHIHPSPHLIFILGGGGWVQYGEDTDTFHTIETGDTFYIPENTRHQVGADDRGMIMIVTSTDSLALTDPARMTILK